MYRRQVRPVSVLLTSLSLLSLLGGCQKVEGVWFFEFPYTDEGIACEDTVKHNFKDMDVIEDDVIVDTGTGLEYTEEYKGDSTLSPAVIEVTGDHGTLMFGGAIFPGVKEGGEWVFSWDEDTSGSEEATYEDLYAYRRTSANLSKTTIRVSLSKGDLTGSVKVEGSSSVEYSETDEWGNRVVEVIGNNGQIPAGAYLEDADGNRARNVADTANCEQESCTLEVSTSCSGTGDFTGFRTSYSVQEATDMAMKASAGGGGDTTIDTGF